MKQKMLVFLCTPFILGEAKAQSLRAFLPLLSGCCMQVVALIQMRRKGAIHHINDIEETDIAVRKHSEHTKHAPK